MRYPVALAMAGLLALPALAQTNPVETVPADHWAYGAVKQVVDSGLIIGYGEGTFKGDRPLTRYEFAISIARLLQLMPVGAADAPGPRGAPGPDGPPGPQGQAGEPG